MSKLLCGAAALMLLAFTISGKSIGAEEDLSFSDIKAPEHGYWDRPLNDPFTRFKEQLEQGSIKLDYSSEKRFLTSLLKALNISESTQMLVYSTTSLQLSLISPKTPRAVYFNEDIYLGYVQGGRIEIVSIDPELGGIFYIFDIPRGGAKPVVDRSRRCMNCHSGEDTHEVPGVVIKSVIPGPKGGSLDSYRRGQSGHGIPFSERFGGWHVTGADNLQPHWGNLTGNFTPDGIVTTPLPPGEAFDWSVFPVATSDILAHLLHEHQAGFVNRVIQAHYRIRTALHNGRGKLPGNDRAIMAEQADMIARYLLFADEAELPEGGIAGDSQLKEDFLAVRKSNSEGDSLRDFDLEKGVFRNRCSYMIYTPVFQNLPEGFKKLIYNRLAKALAPGNGDPEFAYLLEDEKVRIRAILAETLSDLPKGWQ
ncbi:MAG: hypothetical protein P1U86_06015 [Verrucomicrobiales bacterium]|nr:hypothetical protein [Verrucomicrobiales bacterium]